MNISQKKSINTQSKFELLKDLWSHGVDSVRGRSSVNRFFQKNPKNSGEWSAIAMGKAATDMMLGASDSLGSCLKSGLVLTKYDHLVQEIIDDERIICHESSHPVPDINSLLAGKILLEYIDNIPSTHSVLVMISGGASSLVEALISECSLEDLQKMNKWALHNGLNINEINYMRQQVSLIKGGRLRQYFQGNDVLCLYISDVPEDDINIIGSGPLYANQSLSELIDHESKIKIDFFIGDNINLFGVTKEVTHSLKSRFEHHIISNNAIAKSSIKEYAERIGYPAYVSDESINTNYERVADIVTQSLDQKKHGIYIWGGEPTVDLPDSPGLGGRNQALALLISKKIQNRDGVTFLVAGSDGTDGPTDAAGGLVDAQTYKLAEDLGQSIDHALKEADAYPCLKAINSLFSPGPTGTNVMDLIIAYIEKT